MTKDALEKLLAETQKELENVKLGEAYANGKMYDLERIGRAEGYQEGIREVIQLIRDIFADKERML